MESSGGDYYGKAFPQTQRISHICDKLIHSDHYGVKEYPSRHGLPVQGLPHILDKSFHSDIYTKDFTPRPGFQLPTLTSPMHDKTFHTAMMAYGKEYSPSIPGLQAPKLPSNLMENGGVSAEKQYLHQQGQTLHAPKMSSSLEKSYQSSSHKHYTQNQGLQSPQLPTSMADKPFSHHSSASITSGIGSTGSNSMVTDKHHLLQQSHNMLMQKINSPVHKSFHNNSLSSKSYAHCSSPSPIMHSAHLKQAAPSMADKSYHSNNVTNSNSICSSASSILSPAAGNLYSHSSGMHSQKLPNTTMEKMYHPHDNLTLSSKQYLQSHSSMSAPKMSRMGEKNYINGGIMQGRELLSPNPEHFRSSSVVNMVEKQRYPTMTREKIPSQHHYQPYISPNPTNVSYHSQNNLIEKPIQPPSPLQSPPPPITMQSPPPPITMQSPSPMQSRSPLQSPPPPSIIPSSSPLQSPPPIPPPPMRSPMPLQSPTPPLQSPGPLQSPPPPQPSPTMQSPSPQQQQPHHQHQPHQQQQLQQPQQQHSQQHPQQHSQQPQYKRQLSSENFQHPPAVLPTNIAKQHHPEESHIEEPVETSSCNYIETQNQVKMHLQSPEEVPDVNDEIASDQISPLHIMPIAMNSDNQMIEQMDPDEETAVSSAADSLTTTTALPSMAVTPTGSGTPQSRYHCEFCGKQFAQKYVLQMHRRTHTGEKPFQCDFCIQRFARKDTLKIHRRIHTGETPFQCDICPKQFAQASKLLKHKKRCHLNKKRPISDEDKILLGPVPEQSDIQLPGQIELKTETDILPQDQPIKIENPNPPKRKNGVTCDICLKQFAHRDYLTVHKRSHTGERPFRCDFCPQRFTRRDMLQVHRRTHTGEKPFECTICMKRFAQRDKLHIHTRVHTGEKPYKCQICLKQFSQRNTLVGHLRSHSGERPYQCEICLRRFAQKDYLRVHTRSHTGERPYECDFCIQKFSRRDTLIIHRRIHTGEKPFRCEICGKQFAQTDKLRRHRRTHPEYKQGLVASKGFNKTLNIVKSEIDVDIKPETTEIATNNLVEGMNNEEDNKDLLVPVKAIEDYTPVNNCLWLL